MTLFDDWLNSNNLHHNSDHHDHSYDHNDLGHDHNYDLGFVDDSHSYDLTDSDSHHSDHLAHENFDPHHVDGIVVGEPAHDMQHWHHQNRADSCAVVSQEFILETITGKHFSEAKLCHEAYVDGCYNPGCGTPAMHVGHLLEQHGIPVEQHHNATLAELQDKLANHEKIIVGVDSQTLWMPDKGSGMDNLVSNYHGIPGQQADHAVQVIGINYPQDDPSHPYVILNDPGSPDGKGMMVPLEQFESAWAAGDNFMVSTELHHNREI